MAMPFLNSHGVMPIEYLEKGRTIHWGVLHFTTKLRVLFRENIHVCTKKVLFHHKIKFRNLINYRFSFITDVWDYKQVSICCENLHNLRFEVLVIWFLTITSSQTWRSGLLNKDSFQIRKSKLRKSLFCRVGQIESWIILRVIKCWKGIALNVLNY